MRQTLPMHIRAGVLLFLIAPLMAACSTPAPDRYYLLSATLNPAAPVAGQGSVIGIGPVTIPSHLDRSMIVSRSSSNRLEVNAGHRWAEPLDENINRILLENIDHTGKAVRMETFPWTSRDGVDWQIVVDIDRFERQADGNVLLAARWKLVAFESGDITASNRYEKVVDPKNTDVESTVSAMSDLLADMSVDIAKYIP